MRSALFLTCASVAIGCIQRAAGMSPAGIFGERARWLWWPVAFFLLAAGVSVLLHGVE